MPRWLPIFLFVLLMGVASVPRAVTYRNIPIAHAHGQGAQPSGAAVPSRIFLPSVAGDTAPAPTRTPAPTRSTPASTATPGPTVAPGTTPGAPAPRRMYGVLFGDNRHLRSDWNAGIRVREVELSWRRYEPEDGAWNSAFIGEKRWEFQQARAAGFQLVLDFGIQYPPGWARALGPWKDQYGNSYDGQVNAVWSPEVRRQVEQYIERAFADFGTDFWGVRAGAGGWIETMYPGSSPGYVHSYWAFDDDAAALNPVPNWRPGQLSPNGEARRFYELVFT